MRQNKKAQSLADLIREQRINFSQRYIANLERNRKMESLENVSNEGLYGRFISQKMKVIICRSGGGGARDAPRAKNYSFSWSFREIGVPRNPGSATGDNQNK